MFTKRYALRLPIVALQDLDPDELFFFPKVATLAQEQ